MESDFKMSYFVDLREQYLSIRKSWFKNKDNVLILDTETTGFYKTDQVIELGIIDLDGNILFEEKFKPTVPISIGATQAHGITKQDLLYCSTWKDSHQRIAALLKNKLVLAYNSNFDYRLMQQTAQAFNCQLPYFEVQDVMKHAKVETGSKKNISLATVTGETNQSHRAVDDCLLTLKYIKQITQ